MDNPGIHIPFEIQQYEKKVYDQRQLIELSKALNSQLDLSDLIDSILNSCLAQVQTFEAGILLKTDVESDYLSLHHEYKGFEIADASPYSIHIESPLMEHFRGTQKALTWIQVAKNPKFGDEKKILEDLDLQLLIPLPAKGDIMGIILLGAKATGATYLNDEITFLEDLASLAGIATNNARLYELATTDMMTKLKIHHFFQSKLREEMKKAVKKKKPLSLLFTDIDHFKNFNDTYGHQTGDIVLKEVAKILASRGRKIDTAARYGGEEFCLIMPQTKSKEAFEIAEKIRKAIEINTVSHEEHNSLKVTISIGVAQFNSKTDFDNQALIEKADKALYKAKNEGRNRSIIYRKPRKSKKKA
jgi:diguanylate cyclase (GGDEF)-like protein